MSITKKAMVLNLQIGIWQGYRLDKDASRKVVEDAGANADAARVNKHLVPKEALKEITAAQGAVRTHLYAKTLPWKDNGDRLLTRAMFTDFIEEHERLVGTFNDAVEKFITTDYPQARERAAFRMGDLFKPDDYPSADSLRRKFYVNLDIDAVTEAGDFRVQMDQQQLDSVRSSMEQAMGERIKRAMGDVWSRLSDVVTHYQAKMAVPDAVFRDSTLSNIEELVKVLPGLNVLDDPDLAKLGQDVEKKLLGYDIKDLRKNPEVRTKAAQEAKEIMDRMSGFMTAFGAQ